MDKQDSFHSFYCELTDEQLSKTFYEQVKSTKSDGTNVGDDTDVRGVIKAVLAAVTNKFNYSQNSVKDYSTAMAKRANRACGIPAKAQRDRGFPSGDTRVSDG